MPSLSVALTFATSSLLLGSWVARIPEVQQRLQLGEGQLGLALLGLSLGGLIMTPLSGWILSKIPTGRATLLGTVIFCATMTFPALSWNLGSLTVALFLVGFTNAFMNVSMNAAAASIESNYRLSIMSTCHGLFSLGGMIGAATSSFIAGMGVPLQVHLAGLALILVAVHFSLRPVLIHLPDTDKSRPAFSLPPRALLGLAVLSFCFILGEATIGDWSAVYLSKELKGSPYLAGMGYAGFSLAMALGRFNGDYLRTRFGSAKLILYGGLLSAAGLGVAVLSPVPQLAILGFTLVGFGSSTIVPILFSAAARMPGMNPGAAIASLATAGVLGFVLGRPTIGALADHFGLATALSAVALMVLGAALYSSKVRV